MQPTEIEFVLFVPGQVHDGHDRAVDHAARLGDLWTPEVEVFQLKLLYFHYTIIQNIRSVQKYSIGENFNKN